MEQPRGRTPDERLPWLEGLDCREINPRLRRREKNVLDFPFYRSGVCTNYGVVGVMAMLRQLGRPRPDSDSRLMKEILIFSFSLAVFYDDSGPPSSVPSVAEN